MLWCLLFVVHWVLKQFKIWISSWASISKSITLNAKGPSINYVVSKLAIFDTLPPLLIVFLLCKIGNFDPPSPLLRRHSLWMAPNQRCILTFFIPPAKIINRATKDCKILNLKVIFQCWKWVKSFWTGFQL